MKNLDLTISENIKVYGSLTNFLNAMDCTDIEDYKKMMQIGNRDEFFTR